MHAGWYEIISKCLEVWARVKPVGADVTQHCWAISIHFLRQDLVLCQAGNIRQKGIAYAYMRF